MAGKNRNGWGNLGSMIGGRRAESERCHGATAGDRCAETLAGKPQPCGDTQITRNGLK